MHYLYIYTWQRLSSRLSVSHSEQPRQWLPWGFFLVEFPFIQFKLVLNFLCEFIRMFWCCRLNTNKWRCEIGSIYFIATKNALTLHHCVTVITQQGSEARNICPYRILFYCYCSGDIILSPLLLWFSWNKPLNAHAVHHLWVWCWCCEGSAECEREAVDLMITAEKIRLPIRVVEITS